MPLAGYANLSAVAILLGWFKSIRPRLTNIFLNLWFFACPRSRKRRKRVLLVDLDQQASATHYLDIDPEHSPNLYGVFMGNKNAGLAI